MSFACLVNNVSVSLRTLGITKEIVYVYLEKSISIKSTQNSVPFNIRNGQL